MKMLASFLLMWRLDKRPWSSRFGKQGEKEKANLESHRRSIVKAVSWRVIAIMITTGIAWVVTGDSSFAAAIGITDSALKIGFFYMHERAWNRVKFGNGKFTEYQQEKGVRNVGNIGTGRT
jgi:adenylylsulfate kinase